MGASISGIGSETLEVEGRDRLHGATYSVMPDRIEAGSYACAAAITGGSLDLIGAHAGDMRATLQALIEAGVTVTEHKHGVRVEATNGLGPLTLSTAPYPGFGTDLSEIGRASCREKVCTYVLRSVVAVELQKNQETY